MTLEILSDVGNIPVSNDLLISVAIGLEMSRIKNFRILTGMLLGPFDFVAEKELIILMTSSLVVGDRKIGCGLRFFR